MAGIREFTDAEGNRWSAWVVEPEHAARRQTSDRREPDRAIHGRRDVEEGGTRRTHLRATEAPPWLVFESHLGRRRLTPLPERWESLSDQELMRLCHAARVVPSISVTDRSARSGAVERGRS